MHRSNHTNSIPPSYAQQVSISYILRFAALMLVLSLSLWMFGSQALAGSHTADGGALPACDPNWVVVSSANVTPEATTYLNDVEVLSATDAWAVGFITPIGSGAQAQTLIQHWDGTSWHRVPSPNPGMGH